MLRGGSTPTHHGNDDDGDPLVASLIREVNRNPDDSAAWLSLAFALREDMTVRLGTAPLTKPVCFINVLELNPSCAKAWYGLGSSLKKGDRARVKYEFVTNQECFLRALSIDPNSARTWSSLGSAMRHGELVETGFEMFSKQHCYMRSLGLDPNDSDTWIALGLSFTDESAILMDRRLITRQECFKRAIVTGPAALMLRTNKPNDLDRRHSKPWTLLAQTMRHPDDRVEFADEATTLSAKDCLVRALQIDPECAQSWCELGVRLEANETFMVGKLALVTKRDCFLKGLRYNFRLSKGWFHLGRTLGPFSRIRLREERFPQLGGYATEQSCYVRAVWWDDQDSDAWNALGLTMSPDDKVNIWDRGSVTQRECFIKAVEADPNFGSAWLNLAETMKEDGEEVSLSLPASQADPSSASKTTITRADCLQRALRERCTSSRNDFPLTREME